MDSHKWAALANNTKWNELQQLMAGLGPKAPYWRTQATNGFVYPEHGWDGDWASRSVIWALLSE